MLYGGQDGQTTCTVPKVRTEKHETSVLPCSFCKQYWTMKFASPLGAVPTSIKSRHVRHTPKDYGHSCENMNSSQWSHQLQPYLLWITGYVPSGCIAGLSAATPLMYPLKVFMSRSLSRSLSAGSPVVTQNVSKSTEQTRPQPGNILPACVEYMNYYQRSNV